VKRRALPAVLATVGMAGLVPAACVDLSTDPDEIVAIEFVAPRWPSIVAGDTLRDATGAIVALEARLFGGDGDEVFGAPVDRRPAHSAGVKVMSTNQANASTNAASPPNST
jgi:hypothetical protein